MTLAPAVDWSHRGGATVMLETGTLRVPVPVPPVDPPPPDPTPRVEPRRLRLIACDGLTGVGIVEFTTVDVASYVAGQLGVGAMRHGISVAGTDPAWPLLCAHYGVPAGAVDRVIERVDWRLLEDGVLVASGMTDGPVDWGASVDLRVSGGGGILRDRFLGSGGTTDRMNGRGKFPSASLSGWTIGGLSWRWNTTDPFTGARSLQVRGSGYVFAPWGAVFTSKAGGGRTQMFAPVTVRLNAAEASLAVGVDLRNATTGALIPRGQLYNEGTGVADGDVDGWQQVDASNRSPLGDGRWQARAVIMVDSGSDWVDIGQVVQRQNLVTGTFESSPIALETLVSRVVAKAQREASGGDLGVSVTVHTASGARDGIMWRDSRDPAVSDALSSVLDRTDAPDAWFTPDRVLHLSKRAGRSRGDLALNRDTVIAASVSIDPGSRFDELRAQTGYGAGPTRAVVAFDGPGVPGAPRRRAIIQAPGELSYRSAERWVAGHGAHVAQQQTAITAVVPGWYGRGFAVGDDVPVVLDVEGWRVDRRYRVGRISVDPKADTVALDLGLDERVLS